MRDPSALDARHDYGRQTGRDGEGEHRPSAAIAGPSRLAPAGQIIDWAA